MYKQGKPQAEPLLLTADKMELKTNQCLYVGDAYYNDYLAAWNAGMNFIYFCPNAKNFDVRIPSEIFKITHHKELLKIFMERWLSG